VIPPCYLGTPQGISTAVLSYEVALRSCSVFEYLRKYHTLSYPVLSNGPTRRTSIYDFFVREKKKKKKKKKKKI
jgi:hypothetical protein